MGHALGGSAYIWSSCRSLRLRGLRFLYLILQPKLVYNFVVALSHIPRINYNKNITLEFIALDDNVVKKSVENYVNIYGENRVIASNIKNRVAGSQPDQLL